MTWPMTIGVAAVAEGEVEVTPDGKVIKAGK